MNEAAGFKKTGLNREQRAAAEAALLGVPPLSTEPFNLTYEQAEQMRAILQQHDKNSMPKQFDLNAPPKPPYVFQPFPQMIYDHVNRETRIVHSAEERGTWLAQGWREDAFPREVPQEISLDPDEAAEVAKVDMVLQTKRGPGRPRKVQFD